MAREFTGLLFFGAGDYSKKRAAKLRKRLRDAMNLSSGLQQGGGPSPIPTDVYKKHEKEIEDAVRDIAAALLGRNISLGYTLPYPPQGGE